MYCTDYCSLSVCRKVSQIKDSRSQFNRMVADTQLDLLQLSKIQYVYYGVCTVFIFHNIDR